MRQLISSRLRSAPRLHRMGGGLTLCMAVVTTALLLGTSGFAGFASAEEAAAPAAEESQAAPAAPELPAPAQGTDSPEEQNGPAAAEPSAVPPEEAAAPTPDAPFPEQGAEAPSTDAGEGPQPDEGDAAQPAATTGQRILNGLLLLASLALVFGVPILLGQLIARQLRLPTYAGGISLILFCVIASVFIVVTRWPPKLGIDLSGGVIMVYEIQEPTSGEGARSERQVDMDQLIAALSRRVNPAGVKEVTIRAFGPRQVEIIVPEVDQEEVARLERVIGSVGTLEFRILANRRDHRSVIDRAMNLPPDEQEVRDENGNLLAWWVPIAKDKEESIGAFGEIAIREGEYRGESWPQVLVVNDRQNITGEDLAQVREGFDETGSPSVDFVLKPVPAQRFAELTTANRPDPTTNFQRRLGIILDGFMQSAPNLRSTIADRGQITGDFTREEVDELVQVLQAGSLPAQLSPEPISRLITGPRLGRDTIEQSVSTMVIAAVLVFTFMVLYYRFSGIVASIAVIMNLLMLVAIMILIQAAFTLPGLAGVTLTVGMAVDANVLIYERIREELDRKATLRMAIRNGFAKAMSAIVDSNVTTLITAVVLYVVGTDQVKGFAVTLFLGVSLSLFTAVYCARIAFEIAERRHWITRLKMMRLIGTTNIDFMRVKGVAMGISAVIIVIGMGAVYQRGAGILDIDFTGGVALETVFTEQKDIGEIRRKLSDLRDLAVSDVRLEGEEPMRRFMINTASPPDIEAEEYLEYVQQKLAETFGGELVHYSVNVIPLHTAQRAGAGNGQALWPFPQGQSLVGSMFAALQPEDTQSELPPLSSDTAGGNSEAPQQNGAQSAPSADDLFAGGTHVRLEFSYKITYEGVQELLEDALQGAGIDYRISNDQYRRGDTEGYEEWEIQLAAPPSEGMPIIDRLKQTVDSTPYFPSSNTIGGKVAGKTRWLALWALAGSLVCIIGYIWIRFTRVSYGLAAVVALVHDVLLTLSMIAVSAYVTESLSFLLIDEFKIGLSVLAAFLTIIGYSLNDTIIVFDRIRENKGKSPYLDASMVNRSVNQMLSRTLITSLTTLFVVLVLYIGGGAGIHGFAFALVVGVLVGTYSSIYIASPVLLWLSPRPTLEGNSKKLSHIS